MCSWMCLPQVRYASIRAQTELRTMRITKHEFEMVIGPLSDYVTSEWKEVE